MEGLHDEKLWPKNIGTIETEERRRLVCVREATLSVLI
jgi:hypothetical protein